jgi:hypothetical protein
MAGESVLNRFEQAGGGKDNPLILGGTVNSETGQNLKTKTVSIGIGDISTAGSVWVTPGFAGTIKKISNVIDTTITTADAGLTFEIGGTAVTGADITIAFTGSLPGTVDQSTPTALNVITASEAIEVVKDGLSTVASNGVVTFEIEPS